MPLKKTLKKKNTPKAAPSWEFGAVLLEWCGGSLSRLGFRDRWSSATPRWSFKSGAWGPLEKFANLRNRALDPPSALSAPAFSSARRHSSWPCAAMWSGVQPRAKTQHKLQPARVCSVPSILPLRPIKLMLAALRALELLRGCRGYMLYRPFRLPPTAGGKDT